MMPPKTRPLGEGVCKFSENSDVIYWVKYIKMSIMTSLEVTGGQIEVASRIRWYLQKLDH